MSDFMKRLPYIFVNLFFLLLLLFVASCKNVDVDDVEGEYLDIRYSSLLKIADCDGFTLVDVKNPWGKGLLNRYLLVPADSSLPENLPAGVVLRTPLKNTLLFSGVHASLFEELGALSAIAGVCDSRYIYSQDVQCALEKGFITDCGSSLNIDSEAVMQVAPDAIFVLPYENGGYGKLERYSFPLVECADYMETSPLGCAEWIRFYGRLLGCAEKSDSVFNAVCKEFEALSQMTADVTERPKLMCELKSTSAWYVPGGKSTMGQMYKTAGADYLFSDYDVNGSVPLSAEIVLDKAVDADIWLLKYNSALDKTYQDLLAEYDGYAHFKPFGNKNIYACNTHRNNVFEETAFHPERLLRELVALFHPALLPQYKTVYYEKMR